MIKLDTVLLLYIVKTKILIIIKLKTIQIIFTITGWLEVDPGSSSLSLSSILSGVGGGRHVSPSASPVGVDKLAGLRQ